jgi:MSHA biogenesis protein MshG
MPNFRYSGRDAHGNKVSGSLEAKTVDEVAMKLLADHITPISIAQAQQKKRPNSGRASAKGRRLAWLQRFSSKVSLEELSIFSANMAIMIEAGVPIVTATKQLALTAQTKRLATILTDIAERLQTGQSMADCIKRHKKTFPVIYANLVEVGESSGQLEAAFSQLASYLQNESSTRKRLKSAMRYPKLVVTALIGAMAVINIFVVPSFSSFFTSMNRELPAATRILIAVSNFFVNYWPLLLVVVVAAILICRAYVATPQGRYVWDRYKLKLPIFGKLLQHIILTRFSWSFSLMLKSGVPLLQGLTLVSQASESQFIAKKIAGIRDDIEGGHSLSQSIANSQLFNPLMMQMILVGEESGRTSEMFAKIAETFERETDYTIAHFSDLLEPTLLVCMGGMVLILALGIFMPMFSMMGTV